MLRFALRLVVPVGLLATVAACPLTPSSPDASAPPPRPPLPVDNTDPNAPPTVHGCEVGTAPVLVLPRTSNDEVRRLVEDLTGTAAPTLFASWTPLAQVLGFDTMTESRIDAQTLDVQFRTMGEVAETLVGTPAVMANCPAVVDAAPLCALHDRYDSTAQFSATQGQDCWSYLDSGGALLTYNAVDQRYDGPSGALVWNNGAHPGGALHAVRRFTAPLDGAVTLNVSAFDADAGGGDGVNVIVVAAGNVVSRSTIANGGAADPISLPLQLRRGDVVDFVVDHGSIDSNYDTTGTSIVVAFAPVPASGDRGWRNCGADVVATVAARAWRRPLHADELEDFAQLFSTVSTSALSNGQLGGFNDALTAALTAALLSPNVHYKPELVPGGFADEEAAFVTASRLALYFRGAFADDELWALAMTNALGDDDVIRAQAQRLLTANVDRFTEHFAAQWLDFRAPLTGAQTPLQAAMRKEAHDVFVAVLNDGLPPERLFEPGFTIVDGLLAGVYGLPLDAAAGPTRIATSERGGLLTQGHFLTSTSTASDFKRVIHRGIWTLNRALCQSVPELDAATREEIAASTGAMPPGLPLSEQMAIHRSSTARCIGCHGTMDPLGLALEAFDSTGARRSAYADGSSVVNTFDFYGTPLPSPEALSTYLTSTPDYRACVAEKLLTFGLHRAPTADERCVIDAIGVDDNNTPRALRDMAIDAFVASLKLTEAQ